MTNVLPKRVLAGQGKAAIRVSPAVLEAAALDVADVFGRLATRPEGLSAAEAEARLDEHGPNLLARERRPGFARLLWRAAINPLVVLLVDLRLHDLSLDAVPVRLLEYLDARGGS